MISRFTLSLRRLVDDEVSRWRKNNSAYKQLRGSWSERWMYAATTNVGRLFLYWCLLAIALGIVGYIAQSKGIVPVVEPVTDARLDRILTIQATLAALTYPIVLALVGILLQRTWSDLRVRVYVAYSGALLAGASSLLLVSFLVLYLSVLRVQAASYLDTWVSDAVILWLLVNIGLTAFFLFRSLRYLTPVVQQQSLLQYTAEVLWPKELERRLLQLRWQSAPVIGWPPNENELDQPMIGPSLYGLSGSCTEVAHTSQSTRWLANVRVWPLLWVATRWKRRIPPDVNAQSVWLTFPIVFEQAIETGDDLCRRTGGAELRPLERFFVRRAFKLTTTAPDCAHLDLASVMEELGDAALSSINDGRVNSFSRALSNLLEFHRIAIQLGSYSVGIKFGNYLEMANNPVGSMQTLHGRLLDPYRKLAQHAIDVADTEIGPLQSAAHSTDALLSHVREKASLEVREQLLFIAGFQWGAFRARRHRTIGLDSRPANSDDLPARKSETEIVDAKIARTLCSAWDSIAFQILRQDDLRRDWMDLAQRGKECVQFLEKTTSHVLVAVADNDALVGRWALDLIQRWTGNWFQIIEEHASWEEFPQISEGVLELSWESTEQALGISGEGLRSEATKRRDVFAEILLNTWRDSCGFLATWLLAQTKDGDPRKDLCRSLLKALLSGEALEGAGSTHSIRQPFDHFDATLASWMRANLLESANPNLAGNLWGRLDRWANDSTRRPWVSGRAYGSDDQVETINLADAALLRLLLGPVVQFRVSQALSDATLTYAEQGANYAERTKQRLINVQDQLRTIDLAPWLPAFEVLQPDIAIADIDGRRTQLADELGVLHDRLAARHDEQLNQRALDAARLQEISGACNRIAFSRDDGALPLPYFDTVETVEGVAEEFTLTLPKRNKAELVIPPLATSPSNELSWYEKTARDYVALDIRNKVLAQIQPKEVTVESAEEFADALDKAASELYDAGFEALLFVASRRDVDYRWRSELVGEDLDESRPIHIEKHEGYVHPGYLLHANGIPAIRMTIQYDSAYLIPRECFDSVRFVRMPDGAAARLDVNEEPDQQVGLALVWAAEVTLRELPTYRFIFGQGGA